MVIDEAGQNERKQRRQERFQRMTKGKSERFKRRMARIERTESGETPRVRVLPKNDELRSILAHPNGNLAFRAEGSIEWPLDQFTLRRLRDGDVTIEEAAAAPAQRRRPEKEKEKENSPASSPTPPAA